MNSRINYYMLLCSSKTKTFLIWILFYIILTQPLVITNKFSTILVQQMERKHQIIFRWTYLTMCIKDVNLLSLEYSYFIIINPKISVKSYHLNKSVWLNFIGLDVLQLKISLVRPKDEFLSTDVAMESFDSIVGLPQDK